MSNRKGENMKIKFIIASLALCIVSLTMSAQDNQRQGRRQQRFDPTEMFNRNAERLAKQMKLDDEKKDLFTVLYLDYQTARQNAANPKGQNEREEAVDLKTLTDEKAKELVEKQFQRTEAQLAVDKEYYAKFLEILTPVQAYQVIVPQRGRAGMGGMEGRPDGNRGFGRPGGFGGPGGGFGGPGGGFGGGGF